MEKVNIWSLTARLTEAKSCHKKKFNLKFLQDSIHAGDKQV